MSDQKIRKKTLLVFFIITPIILAFVVGEIYIRIFKEYTTPELLKIKSLQYVPSVFSRFVFPEKKQVTELTGKRPSYYINPRGYRGKEFNIIKDKGTIRIIIYGGSAVFDIYKSEGKDWPHRIEQILKEKGLNNVEVINGGIPGHTTFDALGRLFSDGWTLNPDYVINYEAWNDICYFTNNITIQKYYKPYIEGEDPRISYQNTIDKLLCETSQLYVRLRGKYYDWKYNIGIEGAAVPTSDEEMTELSLKQYRLNLEMFVDLSRNINAVPVLITQARLVDKNNTPEEKSKIAYEYQKMNHSNLVKAFEKTDEIIKGISLKKKVNIIDPSKTMSGKSIFFKDHVHTTEEGSDQLAKIISDGLFDIISNNN
ncbi:MAG: SGNH/GDSL hydrolase family protein [Ignavibacteria bacterium]